MKSGKKIEEKLKKFSKFLEDFDEPNEKKVLWREIYQNAIHDRNASNLLLSNGMASMSDQSQSDHLSLGIVLSKYLERSTKANDQLIKLADLIQKAEDRKNESMDIDAMMDVIADSGEK